MNPSPNATSRMSLVTNGPFEPAAYSIGTDEHSRHEVGAWLIDE